MYLVNISEDVARDILDTVVDNGRVVSWGDPMDGVMDRDSLKTEIEFEAQERGIDSEAALEEVFNYALGYCETN